MRRRVEEISIFEVFLCMFVILIHVLSEGVAEFRPGTVPSALFIGASRLASFAVPAFIFSSGMKLCMKFRDSELRYPSFLWRRITKIYFPYLLWTVVYYLYFVFRLSYFPFRAIDLAKYLLNGEISAQFYFVLVIMQFYLLMPLWLTLLKKFPVLPLLEVGLLLTLIAKVLLTSWPYNDRILFSYLIFWMMGCSAGMSGAERFHAALKQYRWPIIAIWILLGAAQVILHILKAWGMIRYSLPEPLTILFGIASILGFYLLIADWTPKLSERFRSVLLRIAGASYYIFLVHCLILNEADRWLNHFGIHSLSIRFLLRSALVYSLSTLLCLAYCTVKKRIQNRLRAAKS